MEKTKPTFDLSVVIVTFNNHDLILDCLFSLSRALESYTSQAILIDNFSTDGTRTLLKKAVSGKHLSFQAVQLIFNSENIGYTRAVNQGLHLCKGSFVLMLNPDILFPENPFPALFQCFQNGVGVVAPQLLFPNGNIQPSCRRLPKKRDVLYEALGLSRLFPRFNSWRMPDFDFCSSLDVPQPQGAFLLAKKNVVHQVGVLDERFPMFFSDVDWCRRVLEQGFRIRFCANASVIHHKGASVYQKRARMIVSSHRSFKDYFGKYDASKTERTATVLIFLLLLVATPPRLLALQLRS